MKKMYLWASLIAVPLFFVECKREEDPKEEEQGETLVGNPGNPRFNLQFTNAANVDLDLYVKTPSGKIIYYANPTADNGKLDVDCLCGDCPNGPNENIYWVDGTAPSGKYEFWVEYYSSCSASGNLNSDYTLRLVRNEQVLQTYTGSLATEGQQSTRWTHNQN